MMGKTPCSLIIAKRRGEITWIPEKANARTCCEDRTNSVFSSHPNRRPQSRNASSKRRYREVFWPCKTGRLLDTFSSTRRSGFAAGDLGAMRKLNWFDPHGRCGRWLFLESMLFLHVFLR